MLGLDFTDCVSAENYQSVNGPFEPNFMVAMFFEGNVKCKLLIIFQLVYLFLCANSH